MDHRTPTHGVGSKQRDVIKFLGRRIESESEVTTWDPPNVVASKVTKPFSGEFTVRFSEYGAGTEFTMRGQMEPGGLFRIAEGLVGSLGTCQDRGRPRQAARRL